MTDAQAGPDARVRLDIDGPIAVITNDHPDKHNAFDDAMDQRLFEILGELRGRPDVRAVVWRAEGKSWSSGRDVSAIGGQQVEMSHHELMRRGHKGIQQLWDLDAPVIVAHKGWSIGGSFQRALLCDIRIAAEGARFMLPEVTYGVIPDTGRRGPALPDLRPGRGQRHGADRPPDGRRPRRWATGSCPASSRPTSSTTWRWRWRGRSPPPRPSR